MSFLKCGLCGIIGVSIKIKNGNETDVRGAKRKFTT